MQRPEIDQRRFLMCTALKHNTRSLQQLCLPLRNLIGLNVKLLRQLCDRLVALDSCQRDLRFEYPSMIPAWSSWHDCLLISLPITWLMSGFESTYTAVRFFGATSSYLLARPARAVGVVAVVANGCVREDTRKYQARSYPQ